MGFDNTEMVTNTIILEITLLGNILKSNRTFLMAWLNKCTFWFTSVLQNLIS